MARMAARATTVIATIAVVLAVVRPAGLGADIDLSSPAPECFQVVNASHLVGPIVQALEADLAEVSANEAGKFCCAFANGLFDRLGDGVEQDDIDVFLGLAPFPGRR